MSTLPSFDDLVASLGLPPAPDSSYNAPERSHRRTRSRASSTSITSRSSTRHSRSSSCCSLNDDEIRSLNSPQIVVSSTPQAQHEPSSESPRSPRIDKTYSFGRVRRSRYTPYFADNAHARRPSLPTLLNELSLTSVPSTRSASASPTSSHPKLPLPKRQKSEKRSNKACQSKRQAGALQLSLPASTPISSFVRRRTPQSSPTTVTHVTRRSQEASPTASLSPVAIPTVPFVNCLLSPSNDSPASANIFGKDFVFPSSRRTHQMGVRISSYIPQAHGRHSPSIPCH